MNKLTDEQTKEIADIATKYNRLLNHHISNTIKNYGQDLVNALIKSKEENK